MDCLPATLREHLAGTLLYGGIFSKVTPPEAGTVLVGAAHCCLRGLPCCAEIVTVFLL